MSELQFITVLAIKKGGTLINCKGKMCLVLLPEKLCKLRVEYVKDMGITAGALFVNRQGKPLDRSSIWRMMKGLCRAANVAKMKVFPHNLRHLFARTFYAQENDVLRTGE